MATTLRVPNFRFLSAANALRSAAGDLGAFALRTTAALLLQASPLAMGAIAAAGNLSYAVLGLPAGVWIDRWNKRTVLIVADAVLAPSSASIATMAST